MNRTGSRPSWGDGDTPLLVGRIHGLRNWEVDFDQGELRLTALTMAAVWSSSGVPTKARCEVSGGRDHNAPTSSCDCGLYALHPTVESARQLLYTGSHPGSMKVLGIVEAWGRMEVHGSGFRAEFARPVSLVVRPEDRWTDWGQLIERLAGIYDADVLFLSEPEELAEHCSSRAPGLSPDVVEELLARPEIAPADAGDGHASEPTATEEPQKRSLRDHLAGVGVLIMSVVVGFFYVAFWGAVVFGVAGAIFGWFGDDSPSATSIARKHLKVIDDAVLGAASREPVYVAVVKNDDRRRAALDVTPRLRTRGGGEVARLAASGRFDHPANVPPGGAAVAVDFLRGVPVGELAQPALEVGTFRRVAKFPVRHAAARLDRRRCALMAELTFSRRLDRITLIGIARRGGRIDGGGEFRVDSVPRGRSTHDLGRPGARSCGPTPPRWSLYPALALSNGKWGSGIASGEN